MKTTIKRVILIALALVMVFSLCCCKKTPTENSAYSSTDNPIINVDDDDIDNSDITVSDDETSSSDDTDSSTDTTTSNPDSVIGTVPSNDNSSIASGTDNDNGTTVINPSGDNTPTTSTTTNTQNGHTITATYEWHPGLPDANVSYPITILVDSAPVNASQITLSSATSGVSIAGNVVTIPYSVRAAGKTITVTAKHSSGVSCDINIPCFKYTQTFNDDFNGTELDRTKWGEHTTYTSTAPADAASYEVIDRAKSAKNCYEVKDGKLYMLIKDEPVYDTANKIKYLYSECCLDTARGSDPFMQTYGLFQANIACAKFGGINTAFWLLPNGSYSTQYTNFMTEDPRWGLAEIDILEASVAFGNKDRKTFCISEHFYNYKDNYDHKQQSKYYKVSDTITNFHTYSCVWTADALYYYVDSDLIRSTTGLQAESAGGKAVSRAYMIIDVALYLDNGWVGKRDFTAEDLPIAGTVDWVRAYKFK